MKYTRLLLYSKALFLFLLMILLSARLRAQGSNQLNFNKKQLSLQLIVDKLKSSYKVAFDADVNMAKTITCLQKPSRLIS
ncbi:hypothetical protein [Mucilaginibacter paludis]|uniref:Uncharacterized protein n=1 Tax=Mucilaginibacter paludis DSM 18603 TaxID=714943 RepID=H1Y798_9SPHI|nr:hypothetical protein [Mucilaginibacter paludis]EHQ28985.1 hypothetical protein Mucpa_4901 [Mucilaginibacter paludis DSM 18603]